MDAKQKLALTGMGLVTAGIGLGVVGVALIAPAVVAGMGRLVEKGGNRLRADLEDASRKVGTVAGTLHRSFNEATRAGVAELKRNRA